MPNSIQDIEKQKSRWLDDPIRTDNILVQWAVNQALIAANADNLITTEQRRLICPGRNLVSLIETYSSFLWILKVAYVLYSPQNHLAKLLL